MGSPRELILLNKKCQCAAGADADFDIGKKFNEYLVYKLNSWNWIVSFNLLSMNLLLEAESSSYSCDLACDNPSYSLSLCSKASTTKKSNPLSAGRNVLQ